MLMKLQMDSNDININLESSNTTLEMMMWWDQTLEENRNYELEEKLSLLFLVLYVIFF